MDFPALIEAHARTAAGDSVFETAHSTYKRVLLARSRRAIGEFLEAISDPDPAMIAAGQNVMPEDDRPFAATIWYQMLAELRSQMGEHSR